MTDLAKAIERVLKVADGGTINGAYKKTPMNAFVAFRSDIRMICDAAERVSRVSVEDVEKVIGYELDMPLDCVMRAVANNVMALFRGEG